MQVSSCCLRACRLYVQREKTRAKKSNWTETGKKKTENKRLKTSPISPRCTSDTHQPVGCMMWAIDAAVATYSSCYVRHFPPPLTASLQPYSSRSSQQILHEATIRVEKKFDVSTTRQVFDKTLRVARLYEQPLLFLACFVGQHTHAHIIAPCFPNLAACSHADLSPPGPEPSKLNLEI